MNIKQRSARIPARWGFIATRHDLEAGERFPALPLSAPGIVDQARRGDGEEYGGDAEYGYEHDAT